MKPFKLDRAYNGIKLIILPIYLHGEVYEEVEDADGVLYEFHEATVNKHGNEFLDGNITYKIKENDYGRD